MSNSGLEEPFKNESAVVTIGDEGLTLENRIGMVSLFGALTITEDKRGLALAKALQAELGFIVGALESNSELPELAINNVDAPETVKNPFA